jgi:DNA polymerase
MTTHFGQSQMWASLGAYLQGLQECGLDGLPGETLDNIESPAQAATLRGTEHTMSQPNPAPAAAIETLEQIRKSLGDCRRCKLSSSRKQIVFGVGNPHARLVFVGEGPGADEDAKGEPFVGDAGRMLNRIITAMGLQREEVYICNVVKCRPPQNRNPESDEISACSPFLMRQLLSVKPEAIVALGTFASQTVLQTKEPISKLRGKFRDFHGIPLMPTYHPSYLLRTGGNSASFWDVWSDMTQVLQLLGLPVPDKSRKS